MKMLGVIGGLGPMATVYFLQLLTDMTQAETDQQHLEILLHSKPQIPDRTAYILGKSDRNPLPEMIEAGKGLVAGGAELLAIPCITAHYFRQQLEEAVRIPVIDAIEETAVYLEKRGIAQAGILATDGTIESRLFQEKLEEHGICAVIPEQGDQQVVMRLIYDEVKAGKPADFSSFQRVSGHLREAGADVILLACTELSLIKRDFPLGPGYLDVMEALARRAVLSCGSLKEEFRELLD
ncbi:MAG: amino acid racemase [Roseburia sp.]|nr:amino acid racemase [Roseburia sp.]MCM1097060.1 amino acid racemase [Ruminococcus flavefaciens]